MSIIYEALQKVEKRPLFSRPRTNPSPEPKKHSNKSLIVILTVSITAVGLLYFLQGNRITDTSGLSKNSSTPTSLPGDGLTENPFIKPLRFTLPKLSFTRTNSKRRMSSFNTKVYEGIEFTLSGIIYTKRKPVAIINGRKITVGDTVKEAKVTNIKEDSVELIFNNKKIILALY